MQTRRYQDAMRFCYRLYSFAYNGLLATRGSIKAKSNPGSDDNQRSSGHDEFDPLEFLNQNGFKIKDLRSRGGCVWAIGGREHTRLMNDLQKKGLHFKFTERGGRATNYQPGWYWKPEN